MTDLLDRAVAFARTLPPERQDELARVIMLVEAGLSEPLNADQLGALIDEADASGSSPLGVNEIAAEARRRAAEA